jgi:hypothetical protein
LRRIVSVFTAAALMAAMLVVLQVPAMAQIRDFDNNDFFDDNGFFDDNNNNDDDFDNFFFDRDNDDNDFDNFFFDNGFEQETDETGDVSLSTEVVQTGDNSNQCVAPLQFGNTGNLQNAQGFTQLDSSADDIEFEGSSFEFNPEQAVECAQQVQQSAAASSW